MKAAGTKRLKPKCDEPLSSFAFKYNLRRYNMDMSGGTQPEPVPAPQGGADGGPEGGTEGGAEGGLEGGAEGGPEGGAEGGPAPAGQTGEPDRSDLDPRDQAGGPSGRPGPGPGPALGLGPGLRPGLGLRRDSVEIGGYGVPIQSKSTVGTAPTGTAPAGGAGAGGAGALCCAACGREVRCTLTL